MDMSWHPGVGLLFGPEAQFLVCRFQCLNSMVPEIYFPRHLFLLRSLCVAAIFANFWQVRRESLLLKGLHWLP